MRNRFTGSPAKALANAVATALAICLLGALAPGRADAQRRDSRDEPRPAIYRSPDGIWLVDLPTGMEDALDRYNRDFEAWTARDYGQGLDYEPSPRQVPWAVIGDFNGDGRPDIAIAGRTDRDVVIVFLLSTGRSRYRAVEAEREPYDPEDPRSARAPVMTYMYPGRYVVSDARLPYPRELINEQPAVQVSGGRRQGAVVYVVQQNAVVPYYLSTRTAPPSAAPHAHVKPVAEKSVIPRTGSSETP